MSENKKKPRKKAPKKWLRYMTVLGVAAVGYSVYSMSTVKSNLASNVSAASAGKTSAVAGVGGTERYVEKVKDKNDEDAKRAIENDQSFMPSLEAETAKPVFNVEPDPVQPEQGASSVVTAEDLAPYEYESTPPRGVQGQPPPEFVIDPNVQAAMQAYMGQWNHGEPVQTVVYEQPQDPTVTPSKGQAVVAAVKVDSASSTDKPVNPFKLGDVLYAMNKFEVNSDANSPVIAEVLAGPLRGGQFIGGFTRQNDVLVINFTTFSDKEGHVFAVNAYAVDPGQRTISVASSVDNHYLKRWGGLLAASFLKGFQAVGDTISNQGTTTTDLNGTTTTNKPTFSTSDQTKIALSEAGGKLAEKLDNGFDTPPTVKFEPKLPMGIVIVGING